MLELGYMELSQTSMRAADVEPWHLRAHLTL